MLSSIMEYFLRSLLVESSRIARNSRTSLQKVHARAALRVMTESQNVILSALSNAEGNNPFKVRDLINTNYYIYFNIYYIIFCTGHYPTGD